LGLFLTAHATVVSYSPSCPLLLCFHPDVRDTFHSDASRLTKWVFHFTLPWVKEGIVWQHYQSHLTFTAFRQWGQLSVILYNKMNYSLPPF